MLTLVDKSPIHAGAFGAALGLVLGGVAGVGAHYARAPGEKMQSEEGSLALPAANSEPDKIADSAIIGKIADADVDLREVLLELAEVRGGSATEQFQTLITHLNELVSLGIEVRVNKKGAEQMISASSITARALTALAQLKEKLSGSKLAKFNDLQSNLEHMIDDRVRAIVADAAN